MSDECFFCPSCYHLLESDYRNTDLICYSYLLDDDDRNALLSYRHLLDDDDDDQRSCLSYCFLLDDDDQLVFHMHVLQQQDSTQGKPPLMDPVSTTLLTSSSDDQSTTIDYSRFTRFLEVDDSFLSPWNWNPIGLNSDQPESSESSGCGNGAPDSDQPENGDHSNDLVQFMQFQPESFFAREVHDAVKLKEEQPEHYLETCGQIYDGINLEEWLLEEWFLPQHPQMTAGERVGE